MLLIRKSSLQAKIEKKFLLPHEAFLYCISIIILIWRISNTQKERKQCNQPPASTIWWFERCLVKYIVVCLEKGIL